MLGAAQLLLSGALALEALRVPLDHVPVIFAVPLEVRVCRLFAVLQVTRGPLNFAQVFQPDLFPANNSSRFRRATLRPTLLLRSVAPRTGPSRN